MKKILVLLFFISTAVYSQSTFQVKIKNKLEQIPNNMIYTADGGNIISASEPATTQFFLGKFRMTGKLAWSNFYGVNNKTAGVNDIIPTSDSGFAACVNLTDSAGKRELLFFKADRQGNIIWQKKPRILTLNVKEYVYGSLAASKDGGFYCLLRIAESFSANTESHYSLYKFDVNGNMVWNNQFKILENGGYGYGNYVADMIEASDSGIILATYNVTCEYYCTELSFHKFHANGQPEWKYKLQNAIYPQYDPLCLLTEVENKNIVFIMHGDFDYRTTNYIYTFLNTTTGDSKTYNLPFKIFSLQGFLRKNSIDQVKRKSFKNTAGRNSHYFSYTNFYGFNDDWSILNATTKFNDGYLIRNILLEKYDKGGRICPVLKVPNIDSTVTIENTIFKKYTFLLENTEDIVIEETQDLTVTPAGKETNEICMGRDSETETAMDVFSISISKEKNTVTDFRIAPNPVTDNFSIYINTVKGEQIQLTITDLNGAIIKKQNLLLKKGNNTIKETLQAVASGHYFVQVKSNDWIKNLKIFKQ